MSATSTGLGALQLDLLSTGHKPCTHRKYLMSCEQWDQLNAQANGQCQICGSLGCQTKNGKLFIDHEPHVGRWAVRGLLCNGCNSSFGYLLVSSNTEKAMKANLYQKTAWYTDMLSSLGFTATLPPEPMDGSVFADFIGRRWRRTRRGTWRTHSVQIQGHNWRGLVQSYGPHNLRPVAGPAVNQNPFHF